MLKNKKLSSARHIAVEILRYVFLISFAYILVYPVIYMLTNAVRTTVDYIDPSIVWLPKSITLQNFKDAWKALKFGTSFKNTVVLELFSAAIEVFTCSVFAYGLSRFKFRFKSVLMFFLILSILIPDIMVLLPRVLNFKHLDFLGIFRMIYKLTGVDLRPDIYDTPLTFYLPSLLGVGLKGGMFIFIYMLNIH